MQRAENHFMDRRSVRRVRLEIANSDPLASPSATIHAYQTSAGCPYANAMALKRGQPRKTARAQNASARWERLRTAAGQSK